MSLQWDDVIEKQAQRAVLSILADYSSGEENLAFTAFKLKSLMYQAATDNTGFFIGLAARESRQVSDDFALHVGLPPSKTVPTHVDQMRAGFEAIEGGKKPTE